MACWKMYPWLKCMSMNVSFSRNPQSPRMFQIENTPLPNVLSTKVLGITIEAKLKWDEHVSEVVRQCNRKLYMFRTIKKYGLNLHDLKTVYIGYIRPILEYCAPVFNSGLTQSHVKRLEQIQKRVFRIMLGHDYISYQDACQLLDLPTLECRRKKICEDFAKSLINHPTCNSWLPPKRTNLKSLRHCQTYQQFKCKTQRFRNSPLPYFVDLLNENM